MNGAEKTTHEEYKDERKQDLTAVDATSGR